MTTVTSDLVSEKLLAALMRQDDQGRYPTGLADNWFAPRDWPTTPDEMPIGLVQSPTERKENLASRTGAPQFNVDSTMRLIARLYGKAGAGEAAAVALLGALAVLQRQIEVAVVNDFDLWTVVQQCKSIEVTNTVKKDGEYHFGELIMDFVFEFYQAPEDFAPNVADPLDALFIYADLVNVFSPSGDFSATDEAQLFPNSVLPPPRASGPDGRPEAVVFYGVPTILDFSDPDNSGLLPPL